MKVWKQDINLDLLNATRKNTLVDNLGIEFTEIGSDYIKATMPVDERTKQPLGLLHGGASVCLAETLGSVAATFCLEQPLTQASVGIEINANHMSSAKSGIVTGTARPLKLGNTIHVWEIKIHREDGRLICQSRLTLAIIDRSKTK